MRHKPVEITVARCTQVEVVNHGSQDLGVGLGQPLGVRFDGKFPGDVLAQETKKVNFFWGDRLRCTSNIGSHDSQRERQNHKGSHDHPLGGKNAG